MSSKENHLRELKHMMLHALGAKPTLESVCQMMANTYTSIEHYAGEWRKKADKPVACRSGCAFCCTQIVWVTEPEAIYLAETARENKVAGMLLERVEEILQMTTGRSVAERTKDPIVCPFVFTDNSCFVYSARPVACRALYAANVRECIDSVKGGAGVHYFGWPAKMATDYRTGVVAALSERGIRCHMLEFFAAMQIALSAPNAALRWLVGENAFKAAVSPDQPLDVTLVSQFATL